MDLAAFRELRTAAGAQLLAGLSGQDVDPDALLATVSALRSRYPEALVSAAVTQARLRSRAASKFGPDATRMFFTETGMEQATRATVATHRARRFAGVGRLLDLCCGIGGDLIAMSRAGVAVHGVEADTLTAEVAGANVAELGLVAASVERADALSVDPSGWPAAFCDPSRRAAGRRIFDPESYSPPFGFLTRLAALVPAVGAKVAPGIPHDLVPAGAEAEWVSDHGEVKEAALWFGPLSTVSRRATLLPSGATLVASGALAGVGPVGRYLHEPDGAVIRAGLVAEAAATVGGHLIDSTIAYVTTDSPAQSPFMTAYEVTDVLRFSLKRLRAMLRARDVGTVTVKKRGSAIDPARLRQQLRLSGHEHATIVVTRVAGEPTAVLCRPRSAGS